MNKANPVYEIHHALLAQYGNLDRAASAVNERTTIRKNDALRILAGHQSPTLDEVADLARMAEVKLQVVVTVEPPARRGAA